jgi:uncharacterized protein YdaU (DUF1376 family)
MRHPCLTWWPEKFLAATADMTPDGAAYYRLLLDHAWVRGGSLPNNDDKLRLMTRLSVYRWRAVRAEILEKFTLSEDGRLHHPRMDAEWQRAEQKHKKLEGFSSEATQIFKETNGKKSRKNKAAQLSSARARDPTPTPTEKNSAFQAESSSLAPASLSVRAHASPSLRLVSSTEPSRPPDDGPAAEVGKSESYRRAPAVELPEIAEAYRPEDKLTPAERVRIADEIVAKLAAEIARDKLTEPRAGTIAELERQAAEAKLEELTLRATVPVTVSPLLAAQLSGTPPPGRATRANGQRQAPKQRKKAKRAS